MRNGRLCVLVDDGTAAGFGVERAPGPSEIFELKGPVRYVVGRNSLPRSFLDVSWISPSSRLSSPFFFALIDDRPTSTKEPRRHHLGQTSTAYQRQSDPSISSSFLGLNCLVSSGRGGVALPAAKHGAGIA